MSNKVIIEEIKAMLIPIIGDLSISIEHVGSTSIEGLSAKPIIDIDVLIRIILTLRRECKKIRTTDYCITEGQ